METGIGNNNGTNLVVVYPKPDDPERAERLDNILLPALRDLQEQGTKYTMIEKVSRLRDGDLRGRRIIFAICLSEAGINIEYYKLLEYFRAHEGCLEGSVGGIIVDGASELYTKALARRLAFSANMAGCTFPGKPLVEATGSLGNFHVLSGISGKTPIDVYEDQVRALLGKVLDFGWPVASGEDGRLRILAVHASTRSTSNTMLLWDKVKTGLADRADIEEISVRNGTIQDCRGCNYETCYHFGEKGKCFYGGIMTEQVYPALLESDAVVMVCPNYNDAVCANLTAFINRLTALFRAYDFSQKRIYAIVVSGYSGGDIVSEQIIGAFNFNKSFILPPGFAMVETANDPKSILAVPDIDKKAALFADRIR